MDPVDVKLISRDEKPLHDILALAYVLFTYITGVYFLLSHSWISNIIGTLFVCHSIVISGFIHHETVHGNLFVSPDWNSRIGKFVDVINGGCYFTFEELKAMHILHHSAKVDFMSFDIGKFARSRPIYQRTLIEWCEWSYIPILSYLSRCVSN